MKLLHDVQGQANVGTGGLRLGALNWGCDELHQKFCGFEEGLWGHVAAGVGNAAPDGVDSVEGCVEDLVADGRDLLSVALNDLLRALLKEGIGLHDDPHEGMLAPEKGGDLLRGEEGVIHRHGEDSLVGGGSDAERLRPSGVFDEAGAHRADSGVGERRRVALRGGWG